MMRDHGRPGICLQASKVQINFFSAKPSASTDTGLLRTGPPFPNAAIAIIHSQGIPYAPVSGTFAAFSGRPGLKPCGDVVTCSVLILSVMDLFLHFASCMNSNAQLIIIVCLAAVVAIPLLGWIVKENRKFHVITWDSTDSNHYLD